MSAQDVPGLSKLWFGALLRFLVYLALWAILIGSSAPDFAVGTVAAVCATWLSICLLPVSDRQISLPALGRLAVSMPWQSLVAGIDVARRALDPRMPLQPGFVTFACGLPGGPARNAFCALISLQPGTLPVSADETSDLLIHCLDTSQPVAAQMAMEEALFTRLIRGGAEAPSGHD